MNTETGTQSMKNLYIRSGERKTLWMHY